MDNTKPVPEELFQEVKPKDGKIIPMTCKSYIQMSEQYAIDTQLKNLIRTYGLETVMKGMVSILEANE